MNKTKVLATGLSGLVGTRISEILQDKYEFRDLSLTTGIDISDQDQVVKAVEESEAKIVLHMAAKTDVDQCEDDKILGEEGLAWQVNVLGTQNVAGAAAKSGKRIIYISTDFVFDGTRELYTEEDKPNPLSWYGLTKFLGEQAVQDADPHAAVIRISYPYRNRFAQKGDFVHRIIDRMREYQMIYGLTDHIFTPTFVDDIACALDLFLSRNISGIYHAVGDSSLRTIDAVKMIKNIYRLKGKIIPAKREGYFKNGAFRPGKLALNNDKIQALGIHMTTFEKGLAEVKKQDS